MIAHSELSASQLFKKIKENAIHYGGNRKLKIYGTLGCRSGKRMHRKHRVFFETEQQAVESGYRPCGHCMRAAYLKWKASSSLTIGEATKSHSRKRER